MYNFECAGRLLEVEGYRFLAGYSYGDWVHSSNAPHVWAKQQNCKAVGAPTSASRSQALSALLAVAAQRSLPFSATESIRKLLAVPAP